jgi:hypothetical protein
VNTTITQSVKRYAVVAIPKRGSPRLPLTLRIFDDEAVACQHALKVNMDLWDDVLVEPRETPGPQPLLAPPPFPWNVLWTDEGHAYVTDAHGRKIASLLGTLHQRWLVASVLCDLTAQKPLTFALGKE